MSLMARERESPEMALARQSAERDLAELERTRTDRLAGLDRLSIARTGPVRHVATAIVLTPDRDIEAQLGTLRVRRMPVCIARRRSGRKTSQLSH